MTQPIVFEEVPLDHLFEWFENVPPLTYQSEVPSTYQQQSGTPPARSPPADIRSYLFVLKKNKHGEYHLLRPSVGWRRLNRQSPY